MKEIPNNILALDQGSQIKNVRRFILNSNISTSYTKPSSENKCTRKSKHCSYQKIKKLKIKIT